MVRRMFGLLTLAATGLAPAVGHATVYFENTGNTSGWSTIYQEHNGSVTQVSSPVYKGSTALRCRQIYDSSYTGRYHSEVRKSGMAQNGMEQRYYGYTFYLPSNWQFVNQNFAIGQYITNYYDSDGGCRTAGVPITMHHLFGTTLRTRLKSGDTCNEKVTSYDVTTSVSAGVWHRLLVRALWRSGTTGTYKVWYDGAVKIDLANVATILNDTKQYTWVMGNYANGWRDDGRMVGTQSTRDIYIDHIRAASVYQEANPSDW